MKPQGPKGLYNTMISMRNGICSRANRIDGPARKFFSSSFHEQIDCKRQNHHACNMYTGIQ